MKHLKTFSIFESAGELTGEQKDFLAGCTNGTWTLNPEGLVDVQGNFNCSWKGLADFKGIRFGRVSGHFACSRNNLTTLDGAPREVGRSFSCYENNLTTLKGAPREVGGDFSCSNNDLASLEGAPQKVGGNFSCSHNNLTTLEGAPQKVGKDFYCYDNKLTTLVGAPQTIGGEFNSSLVMVSGGQWSLQTLAEMYIMSSGQEKEMLGTLVSPEALQKEIDANPERAAVDFKSLVHLPQFAGLKWPESLKTEVDLLSDLDSVGL